MHSIAFELHAVIEQHHSNLLAISEEKMAYKPVPSKWSKKEIMGHLVDSAQNNIRRFIVSQYEDLPLIVYDQDKWVAASGYQTMETADIINLWHLLNKQLASILNQMPAAMMKRQCRAEKPHTMEWLAQDYFKHLRHHLHQVLDLEPVAYP
jgi:hypothetical protein